MLNIMASIPKCRVSAKMLGTLEVQVLGARLGTSSLVIWTSVIGILHPHKLLPARP